MRRRLWLGLLALIIVLTLLPGRIVPNWASGDAAHFLAYATLAVLAWTIIRRTRTACSAIAVAGFFSVALEYAQLLVPGRRFQTSDMIASLSGLLAGTLLGAFFRRRRS